MSRLPELMPLDWFSPKLCGYDRKGIRN